MESGLEVRVGAQGVDPGLDGLADLFGNGDPVDLGDGFKGAGLVWWKAKRHRLRVVSSHSCGVPSPTEGWSLVRRPSGLIDRRHAGRSDRP